MVKRLRRRPLTAESGVRFPMRVPKETGTAMCLFFVYSAWGICAQAQLPTTRQRRLTGTTMCLFFVYSAWRICAQAQLLSTRYQKKQALQCACFFVYSAWGICASAQLFSTRYQKKQALQCACFFCCNERGTERRVKKSACGQAELFVGICVFAPSLDLGKRRTRVGGFAEGRKRARGQPARHTRAFVY